MQRLRDAQLVDASINRHEDLMVIIDSILKKNHPQMADISNLTLALQSYVVLDLGNRDVTIGGFWAFTEALKQNQSIKVLYLDRLNVGEVGAEMLVGALIHNKTLVELDLSSNDIGDEGARHIASAIDRCFALKYLALNHNSIGSVGASHLSQVLRKNRTLCRLVLFNNDLGDVGAVYFSEMLRENQALKSICLRFCKISAQGVREIILSIENNCTLSSLDLGESESSIAAEPILVQAIMRNQVLRKLNIGEIFRPKESAFFKLIEPKLEENKRYMLLRPAIILGTILHKAHCVDDHFSKLPLCLICRLFQYCDEVYTQNNLEMLVKSLQKVQLQRTTLQADHDGDQTQGNKRKLICLS